MYSKKLMLSTLSFSGFMLAASSDAVKLPKRPNILFLFSDDHALKSISAYGNSLNVTPNIDSIAKDGVIFVNNFCANSICAPSRACILTGKHSHLNGQLTNYETFNGAQETFPKLLQSHGYNTALIGKWHLKSNPTGFDHWMVYPNQGSYYNPVYKVPAKNGKTKNVRIEGYSVEVTADLAMDWLTKQKSKEKPFLLMCQFKAPHRTWAPGPKYVNMYEDKTFPVPDSYYDNFERRVSATKQHRMGIKEHMYLDYDLKVPTDMKPSMYKGKNERMAEVNRMTPAQRKIWDAAFVPRNEAFLKAKLTGKALAEWKYQRYVKNYLRCVAAVDDNIGRILKKLKALGLDKKTIVIYSSDQGFYLVEHGWFDKRWMYEESFRMPLVMKWPGVIKPGTRVEKLTQNIDFAPTFLEACGVSTPKAIQGKSLIPLVTNQKVEWRDAIYYHYYESPSEHGVPFHFGVRGDRYKLIYYYQIDKWELFDLKRDPKEMNSVYDNPEYKGVVEKMKERLKSLRAEYKCNYDGDHPDPVLKRQMKRRANKKK